MMKRTMTALTLVFAAACSRDETLPLGPNSATALLTTAAPTVSQLYTESNDVSANAILAFDRAADGSLTPAGSYPTGGTGTGAGLGSQGAVTLTRDGRYLLAVNAGSSEVSLFAIRSNGSLELSSRVGSGGITPISVTNWGSLVYVLNGGGTGNIAGFRLINGRLTPIAGSSRPLSSSAAGAAQVSFAPNGKALVVTEKSTNSIDTYAVDANGLATGPVVNPSSGATPFGFEFSSSGLLVVSEAFGGAPDGSAVSSYEVIRTSGALRWISPSVGTTETAACWIAITPNQHFTYTTNTASGTISGYSIVQGVLVLLDADGVTGNIGAGSSPTDLGVTGDGHFLYANASGAHTITGFDIASDGSLAPVVGAPSIPVGAAGLAVR
ncbi:MAG: beta-propeller fold lactonase family protein [Gemmatimonadaceae bacterium]